MSDPLTASDFWPLILKLPHDERVLLAKLALRAAAQGDSSAAAYAAAPPALPDKRRPVRLLSRDAMLPSLNEVIVVPATRTIRGIDTEVVHTADDGMPAACALNFDHVSLARKERIGPTIARLDEGRWHEIERALLMACGFAPNA